MKVDRHLKALLAALVVGAAATWLAHRLIQEEISSRTHKDPVRTVSAVVASRALDRGTLLTQDHLALRDIPESFVTTDTVLADQVGTVIDGRLARPLAAGEQVLHAAVTRPFTQGFAQRLRPGYRAVTLGVDEVNSLAGLLAPGDWIDLLLVYRRAQQDLLVPLLQHVEVIATGNQQQPSSSMGAAASETGFTTITLQLKPVEAQRLALARSGGQRLTAVLRSPDDRSTLQPRVSSFNDLILPAAQHGTSRASSIALYIGGTGELRVVNARVPQGESGLSSTAGDILKRALQTDVQASGSLSPLLDAAGGQQP